MKCEEIKDYLVDYLDNNLDGQSKNKVQQHLEICDQCRNELFEISAAIDYIKKQEKKIHIYKDPMERSKTLLKEKGIHKNGGAKSMTRVLVVACVLLIAMITSIAIEDFNILKLWQDRSIKESKSIEKLLIEGYGEKLNISVVDKDVKVTIQSVIADEIGILLMVEIEDLKGEKKLFPVRSAIEVKGEFIKEARGDSDMDAIIRDTGYPRGSFSIYSKEDHIHREIMGLDPTANWEDNINIVFQELRYADEEGELSIIKGNWEFEIPVVKNTVKRHKLNETIKLDYNIIQLEELIVAPTTTILTYSYKAKQHQEYVIDSLGRISLSTKEKQYQPNAYGVYYSESTNRNSLERYSIEFDSMFFDNPNEIIIQIDGYRRMVYEQKKLDIDLEEAFPQSFEYMGNQLVIEAVQLEEEKATIYLNDSLDNLVYSGLNINRVLDRENRYTVHSINRDSLLLDKKGREISREQYLELDESKREEVTSYYKHYEITIENDPHIDSRLSEKERGTREIRPYRIFVLGHYDNIDSLGEVTIQLR